MQTLEDVIIRLFDIIFSLLAIVVLSPILIIVIGILKLTGEREVFYIQKRIGKNTKEFGLLKFATMLKNSANIGTGEITLADDKRVLPFGKFLRKTKINELAQLINILKGDLSIIGPRPQTKKYYDAFNNDDKRFISKIKPGLSGIGSIIFRDEEGLLKNINNPVEFDLKIITPYKGQIEKWYVENRSIYLYFLLIFLTVLVVASPSSISIKKVFKDLPQAPKKLKDILN
jgi:lipopolysaccharide/colanic/teichoic acid biosynthesis glycosyltransferase